MEKMIIFMVNGENDAYDDNSKDVYNDHDNGEDFYNDHDNGKDTNMSLSREPQTASGKPQKPLGEP